MIGIILIKLKGDGERMKKMISMALCFTLLLSLCLVIPTQAVNAEGNDIQVILNGNKLTFDQNPIMQDDRVLVPMRAIFEAMGATVTWEEDTQSIFVSKDTVNFIMQVGNNKVFQFDNTEVTLDVPPIVVNDRTLVPIRFIAESFGAMVNWDEANNSVLIDEAKSATEQENPGLPVIDNDQVTQPQDGAEVVHPQVQIEMENGKKIVIELYPEYAPKTVANFLDLVGKGFYDGLNFHRVMPGFMIQGGDPNGDGTGGSSQPIQGEFLANGFTKNTLSHTRGIISMARTSEMDSASSQFFIVVADSTYLDGNYAAFGKVISGMDVVDEIVSTPVLEGGEGSTPVNKPIMKKVTVLP